MCEKAVNSKANTTEENNNVASFDSKPLNNNKCNTEFLPIKEGFENTPNVVVESSDFQEEKTLPMISIPIEILPPEVPADMKSEFTTCDVMQMNAQTVQPNLCEISIDKESQRITITIPDNSINGQPAFETSIISTNSPIVKTAERGMGFAYTRRAR